MRTRAATVAVLLLAAACASDSAAAALAAPQSGAAAPTPQSGAASAALSPQSDASSALAARRRRTVLVIHEDAACLESVQARFNCSEIGCDDLVAGYVNYLDAYYCAAPSDGVRYTLFAAIMVWMAFLLHLIETTVNDYFCASLTLAVDWLKLSPNVAGVAFLALGNAAPGVIASIAAFASNSPKVGIGTTLGAGIFDSCAVIGVITFVGDVRLPRRSYIRDMLFFIGSVVYLLVVANDGYIGFPEALGFIIIYVVFMVIVVGGRFVRILLGGEDEEDALGQEKAAALAAASVSLALADGAPAFNGGDPGGAAASAAESETSRDMRAAIGAARAAAESRDAYATAEDEDEAAAVVAAERAVLAARRATFLRGSTASRLALQRSHSVGTIVPLTAAMLQPLQALPSLPALAPAARRREALLDALPVKASRWTRQFLSTQGGEKRPFRWTSYHKLQLAVQLAERLRARGAARIDTPDGRSVDFLELLARNPTAAGNLAAAVANAVTAAADGDGGLLAPPPGAASLALPTSPGGSRYVLPPEAPAAPAGASVRALCGAVARVRAALGAAAAGWAAVMHVAELPVVLLRKLTVPVMHEGAYRRRLLCLVMPGGFAFGLFTVSHIAEALPSSVRGVPFAAIAAAAGALVGLLLYFVLLPSKARADARGEGAADPAAASLLRSRPVAAVDTTALEMTAKGAQPAAPAAPSKARLAAAAAAAAVLAKKRPWYKRLLWPWAAWLAGPADEPRPTGATFGVLLVLSFVLSLFWMIVITDEIVGVAIFAGKVLGVPDVIMGLTVLAVGSSIGDLAASLTIARDGYATMAVAGAYAGPMLNVLAGIGLPMLLFTAEASNGKYRIGAPTLLTYVSYGALLAALVISLLWVLVEKWRMTHRLGTFLCVWFLGFVALVIALASSGLSKGD